MIHGLEDYVEIGAQVIKSFGNPCLGQLRCARLVCTSTFSSPCFPFLFFLFFFQLAIVDFVNCEQCLCVLFTVPQITLFNNLFIKNGSHNTIYTFKNYFATLFSVSAKISSIQTHPLSIV